jgi:WD40 repeat protein/Skp family chaperone for outer membrane proteins
MSFRPEAEQELTIDGIVYRVAEHPAAPGIPYGQEGRAGIVYQLIAQDGENRALKVFKARYRISALVSLADKLAPFADLPGLQVCQRTVLSALRHEELLRQYPDLNYAVLMPWIEGPTWMEVMLEKQDLAPGQSLALARRLAQILAGMEECGLAHCDLSGPNVLLPGLLPSPTGRGAGGEGLVVLVDVEQFYGPGLDQPELLPSGSSGYAHKTAPRGLWSPTADRFAGAVLLGEMLGWCNEQVRKSAWGENYFDPQEMQQESERFQALAAFLEERWGDRVASLFERAWRSEMLRDCPTFGEWLAALPAGAKKVSKEPAEKPKPEQTGTEDEKPTALKRTAESLYQALQEQLAQGNWEEARRLGQALEVLWPGYRDVGALLEQASQGQEGEQKVGEEIGQWEAVIQEDEGNLAGEREAVGEERRALEDQLRALEAREGELHRWEESLAQAQQCLEEARQLLAAHRWREARQRLERLDELAADISTAPPEVTVTRPEEVELKPMEPSARQQLAAHEWAERLQGMTSLWHSQPGRLARANVGVMSVAFSPDGSLLASGCTDQSVWIWRVEGGECLGIWEGHADEVWSVAFSPDGETLASGSRDGTVRLWKVSGGTLLCTLQEHARPVPVSSVAFSPDGRTLASGAGDNIVRLWEVPEGNLLCTLKKHRQSVRSVAFSPDGTTLVSGSGDDTVCLWRVSDRTLVHTLERRGGQSVAFSPDGKTLASGSQAGEVCLWQVAGGSPVHTLEGHTDCVRSLAFSPDGRILASGSEDGTVCLWQVTDGGFLLVLKEPTFGVNSVAFSPGGTLLAFGVSGAAVRLWGVVP